MESTLQKPALIAAKTILRGADTCAGVGVAQVGLPWLRHHPRLGTSRWAMARRRWGWAAATSVLWGLSYSLWRRLQATRASA